MIEVEDAKCDVMENGGATGEESHDDLAAGVYAVPVAVELCVASDGSLMTAVVSVGNVWLICASVHMMKGRSLMRSDMLTERHTRDIYAE